MLTLPIRAAVLCCPSVLGSRGALRDRREACFVYLLLSLICPSLGRPGIDPLGTNDVFQLPHIWSSSVCSTLAVKLCLLFVQLHFPDCLLRYVQRLLGDCISGSYGCKFLSFPLCSKLAMRHYILFVQLHIPDCLLPCVQLLLGDSSVSLVRTIANSDC